MFSVRQKRREKEREVEIDVGEGVKREMEKGDRSGRGVTANQTKQIFSYKNEII